MLNLEQGHDNDFQITVYYWRQGFMLLAPSFVLDRCNRPYRRLSATLLWALNEPFILETGTGEKIEASAALIAPKVLRRMISAADSNIMIIDFSVVKPEYRAIRQMLAENSVQLLSTVLFRDLNVDFESAHRGELPAHAVQELIRRMVFSIGGHISRAPELDPRIIRVLGLAEEKTLATVTLPWLADKVHLSPSRLRHLFQEQCGSSLTHYLRWNAVWKAVWMWSKEEQWGSIAEAAGFHDPAHLNRAFNEVFGLNPSVFSHSNGIKLIRCDLE